MCLGHSNDRNGPWACTTYSHWLAIRNQLRESMQNTHCMTCTIFIELLGHLYFDVQNYCLENTRVLVTCRITWSMLPCITCWLVFPKVSCLVLYVSWDNPEWTRFCALDGRDPGILGWPGYIVMATIIFPLFIRLAEVLGNQFSPVHLTRPWRRKHATIEKDSDVLRMKA